jgi:hypothetical protein
LTRLIKQHAEEEKRQRHEKEVRPRLERELTSPTMARWESKRKRELLELKLEDAEWILEHEKRLAALQKKAARQRSQGEQRGANTERLRKLEHHLAGLRRNLSLD